MSRIPSVLSLALCLIATGVTVLAAPPDLPVVTASAALDHMRFTSTPTVAEIRVEVAAKGTSSAAVRIASRCRCAISTGT
jgi:hypothetical protein